MSSFPQPTTQPPTLEDLILVAWHAIISRRTYATDPYNAAEEAANDAVIYADTMKKRLDALRMEVGANDF